MLSLSSLPLQSYFLSVKTIYPRRSQPRSIAVVSFCTALYSSYPFSGPCTAPALAKTFSHHKAWPYLMKSREYQIQKTSHQMHGLFPQTRLHLCNYSLHPLLRMPAFCRVSAETGCIVLPGLSSSDHRHVHEKKQIIGKKLTFSSISTLLFN